MLLISIGYRKREKPLLYKETEELRNALRELWQALGIEPVIRWVLDKLTIMLDRRIK